ncbi:lysozyme inhibitor LprI family protein [Rhizomicrobium electricum]|uniref:DUF1311 domain-containing protein n=1 Tax=Rhizomicrobium electricum TaxID=480070 RepID=A0ABP3PNM5_9PROT|nr:lysozyme inhibitor LprI family protein [Rhizomicrobium electricum]NIJ48867.1 hypothetical protein [Rhizomicrobium electricum]
MRRIGIALIAVGLMAVSANAADLEMQYVDKVDRLMENGDYVAVKGLRAEMERRKLSTMLVPSFADLDHCIAAGSATVTQAETKAIAADKRNSDNFSPDELTAMVAFANGWGVRVDRKRATALACRSDELTRAEWEDTVEFLASPKNAAKPYLFCEHITSGLHGGMCEGFAQDKDQVVRDRKLAKIVAGFTPEQKSAFAALKKADEAYTDAHSREEQDMSGTLRGAFYAEEAGKLRAAFLNFIEGFESGKRPPKDDFAVADKALNGAYRTVITKTDWTATGTVTADGVRKTERLWLKLRDAWAAFGTARYPGSSADDWKAWATRQRVESLKAGFRPFE